VSIVKYSQHYGGNWWWFSRDTVLELLDSDLEKEDLHLVLPLNVVSSMSLIRWYLMRRLSLLSECKSAIPMVHFQSLIYWIANTELNKLSLITCGRLAVTFVYRLIATVCISGDPFESLCVQLIDAFSSV